MINKIVNTAIYTAGYQISFNDRHEILSSFFKDISGDDSPHFSLTSAGIVAGSDIITESEVRPRMRNMLDGAGVTRDSATWSGDVVSFTVGDLVSKDHDDGFLSDLKGFITDRFDESEIAGLADQWFLFIGDTLLDGNVALAENDKGSVYMHFGMGGGQNLPTIYGSRKLIEYLLQNDRDSLEKLIRYELNRREHRKDGRKDNRPSNVVARESGLSGEPLGELIKSLEEAEVEAILTKSSRDIASEIKRRA